MQPTQTKQNIILQECFGAGYYFSAYTSILTQKHRGVVDGGSTRYLKKKFQFFLHSLVGLVFEFPHTLILLLNYFQQN